MKDATSVQPTAKYRKDYQPPSHTITHVDLEFDLHESSTKVVATSKVIAQGDSNTLELHGEQLSLKGIQVDQKEWTDFEQKEDGLVISNLPSEFELTITTEIDPSANTALEGLYMSDGAFCTQCEAEGFRRVTYFLDRPDVLAKYTVLVEADKKSFPILAQQR
ncbi:membrane alanine aminopeptidase N [Vibrio ishigakensis]|uniref:Membrane alanine aminopeptidase N n=1 Tax=Vibrio ishigakensis TaxID=1481914 RepID=A0A0B8PJ04_9VIBR|nr:membrane alanine aminopeptidase N [Vibrio ishigakensis]